MNTKAWIFRSRTNRFLCVMAIVLVIAMIGVTYGEGKGNRQTESGDRTVEGDTGRNGEVVRTPVFGNRRVENEPDIKKGAGTNDGSAGFSNGGDNEAEGYSISSGADEQSSSNLDSYLVRQGLLDSNSGDNMRDVSEGGMDEQGQPDFAGNDGTCDEELPDQRGDYECGDESESAGSGVYQSSDQVDGEPIEDATYEEESATFYEEDATFEEKDATSDMVYLGAWNATAYCPCEICCGEYSSGYTASGTLATEGRTVACNELPIGTQLMIDGNIYVVEDTGWSPYENWLDIYFDNHESALAFGLRTVDVYLIGE